MQGLGKLHPQPKGRVLDLTLSYLYTWMFCSYLDSSDKLDSIVTLLKVVENSITCEIVTALIDIVHLKLTVLSPFISFVDTWSYK